MSETNPTNNRNTILIVAAIAALVLLCCCILLVVLGAFFVVRSGDSGPQMIYTSVPGENPPGTGPVTIQSFSVNPGRIQTGECAILEWSVQGADNVVLLRDEVAILENARLTDSYKDCHDQPGIFRYRLEANNNDGFYQWMELQVIAD